MKILDNGQRVQCRVMIIGSYRGETFVYEDPKESDGSQYIWKESNDPSEFWWSEGNMACDCNRIEFMPEHLQKQHSGECGHEIKIQSITPVEGVDLPTLQLNEGEETL